MQIYLISTIFLVGLFHGGRTADIVKGYMISKPGDKCLGVSDEMAPVAVAYSDDLEVCEMITVMSVDGGGYTIAQSSDTNKQLIIGPAEAAASTLGAPGSVLKLSNANGEITDISHADASALTDMAAPFHISLKAGTATECLLSDMMYKLSADDNTVCTGDDKTWYIKTADCTDANCMTCNLGADMCSACNDMSALDTATKACTACSTANANCKACGYSSAETPVLECSECKDNYELKDDKSCAEKDDDDNGGPMTTSSLLVVMTTLIMAVTHIYN